MADFIIRACPSPTRLSLILSNYPNRPSRGMAFLFDGHSGSGADDGVRYHRDNAPLPAKPSLRPQWFDVPMKVIGPFMGHDRFKLGC